jgi:hypothetical protein
MKKVILGIAIAIAAISASAFTTINDDYEGELVGKLGTNQWVLIDPQEQGLTWDCFDGGTVCTGTLKAGATPDMSGYFSDSEVNQTMESKHFEYISPPIEIRMLTINK